VPGQIASLLRRNAHRFQRALIRLPNKPGTLSSRSFASRVHSCQRIAFRQPSCRILRLSGLCCTTVHYNWCIGRPASVFWPYLNLRPVRFADVHRGPIQSASLRERCRCSLDWLLRRSQRDQCCTDDDERSHSPQNSALVRLLEYHHRHNSGVSETRPCREGD
jgi:hypothetical protein